MPKLVPKVPPLVLGRHMSIFRVCGFWSDRYSQFGESLYNVTVLASVR